MVEPLKTEAEREFARRILAPLLDYEGGELQSMSETVWASIHNRDIIKHAADLGVVFTDEDMAVTGRKK